MKALGVDYGERRIGIAVSDEQARLAVPRTVLENRGMRGFVDDVCTMVKDNGVSIVVFGLPLSLDGREGPLARRVRECAEEVRRSCGVRVAFEDERLTTRGAERAARARGDVPASDADAAALILQSYVDRLRA